MSATAIVLFGATGDLARRKLFPALFQLFQNGELSKETKIFAFARKEYNDETFRAYVESLMPSVAQEFLNTISYFKSDLDDDERYTTLRGDLASFGKVIFYLAIPPQNQMDVVARLVKDGFGKGSQQEIRIAFEKPFGENYESAKTLNAFLLEHCNEGQIFRTDHYLAKSPLQDFSMFPVMHPEIQHLFDPKVISSVTVRLFEKQGVVNRGAFYDTTGALIDVGQNHALQMLASCVMSVEGGKDAPTRRRERAEVLGTLSLEVPSEVLVRGQYEGYREEEGVKSASETETFFSLRAYARVPEWSDVPFVIQAGKALSRDEVSFTFTFASPQTVRVGERDMHVESLRFEIQPNALLTLIGHKEEVLYPYTPSNTRDAYEHIFLSLASGDQSMFLFPDEAEAMWRFTENAREALRKIPLHTYPFGWDSEIKSVIL